MFEPCPPCKIIIDGGAMIGATVMLALQVVFNTIADLYTAFRGGTRPPEQIERERALAEYNCKLAAFLRERTAYIRVARVGTDADGVHGVFGGEYEGAYEIDVAHGIKKKT